jgi:hypothetical protein
MAIENKPTIKPSDELSEFLLYTAPDGAVKIEIYFQNESVWLTQQKIADLFGVSKSTISEHFKNIFESEELNKDSTVRNFRTVQLEGNREVARNLEFYNLDAIISVGYRVNSTKATQFRIWATKTLREYIIKGFVMDDDRLKNGQYFGKDYFKYYHILYRRIYKTESLVYHDLGHCLKEKQTNKYYHYETTKKRQQHHRYSCIC